MVVQGDAKPPYPDLSVSRKPTPPLPNSTPLPAPMPSTQPPAAMTPPLASTARPVTPTLGLPVTAEQQTLDQVYARNLAAQAAPRLTGAGQAMVPSGGGAPLISPSSPSVTVNDGAYAPGMAGYLRSGTPALVIKFGHGQASLSGAAKKKLSDFRSELKNTPGRFRIVGHASRRTGDMDYGKHLAANFGISVDRAESVGRELRRLGVTADRLLIEAVGDSQPRYHEIMPKGESENRRVEIFLE